MSRKKKCSFTLWAPFAPSRFSGSWNPQVSVNSKRFSYLCQKPADSLSRFSGQLLRPEDRWLDDKIFYKPFQAGIWLLSLLKLRVIAKWPVCLLYFHLDFNLFLLFLCWYIGIKSYWWWMYLKCRITIRGFRSSLRKAVSPKGCLSEGSFLRRVISPKGRFSEGSFLRKYLYVNVWHQFTTF